MQLSSEYIEVLRREAEPLIKIKLKELFESKKLYQSITIDANYLYSSLIPRVKDSMKTAGVVDINEGSCGSVIPEDIENFYKEQICDFVRKTPMNEVFNAQVENFGLGFAVESVRTFCDSRICGRATAHSLYEHPIVIATYEDAYGNVQQILSCTYFCKECKKELVSYLVRRDGATLTLSGRTPMEYGRGEAS